MTYFVYTEGSFEEFERVGKDWSGDSAIKHLFKVGTGLDSQILGDFEIIAQLKKSFNFSKANSPFLALLWKECLTMCFKQVKELKTKLTYHREQHQYLTFQFVTF